jgi:hypothetical protein
MIEREIHWRKIGRELGLDYGRDVRVTTELPCLHPAAGRAVDRGDLDMARRFLENSEAQSMVLRGWVGSVRGRWRGFEFALFQSMPPTEDCVSSSLSNAVMRLEPPLNLGLRIAPHDWRTTFVRLIRPGRSVRPPGRCLAASAQMLAKQAGQAEALLSRPDVETALVDLYRACPDAVVTDTAVRCQLDVPALTADQAETLMTAMAEAGRALTSPAHAV